MGRDRDQKLRIFSCFVYAFLSSCVSNSSSEKFLASQSAIDSATDFCPPTNTEIAVESDAAIRFDAGATNDLLDEVDSPQADVQSNFDIPNYSNESPDSDSKSDLDPFANSDDANSPDDQPNKTTKVLILGNSITHHPPLERVGWTGDWGMAASTPDKDFVHQLMTKLEEEYFSIKFEYKEQNIAAWEGDFSTDLDKFPAIKDYKPDLLVVRLGENVIESYARDCDYQTALNKLIERYKAQHTKVVITGNFWPSPYKDEAQRNVAISNNYNYVDLTSLQSDKNNKAIGFYQDSDVADHPSDIGMQRIAQLIFNCITVNRLISN